MAAVYYALNGRGLTGSPPDPAITEPPEAYNRDILKRQNAGTYDICGYYSLPGSASMETSMETTPEPTSSDGELTTKTGTTAESNTQKTTSPAEPSSNSSAPTGAIVGGVLGGLAILAFIGFGLWFIRHKKRQAGNGSHLVATIDQPPVAAYHPQQSVTQAQGLANYQPLASGIPPEPKAYSPSSTMLYPAFNEAQPFHHDSTSPARYL
ncbi:hypothetical protein FPANT_1163 [Fusarium pseudoanthophilum]|uniref:Uncharacterized protein n=1 Tax=Fusarium pseudoanthophilum TaxID=48495 RepID=A0A8H5Q0T0_9HYPO|nr:hypothetical protein FPANT_1163 [Fusarium pseudoanthophilum]